MKTASELRRERQELTEKIMERGREIGATQAQTMRAVRHAKALLDERGDAQ